MPTVKLLSAHCIGHYRLPATRRAPACAEIGSTGEHAAPDSGECRCAQRRCLVARGHFDGGVENVAQELCEPRVLRHAAVDPQRRWFRCTVGTPPVLQHRIGQVASLESDALQRRADQIGSISVERQAVHRPAYIGPPVWRTHPDEGRYNGNPVVVLCRARQFFGLGGTVDEAELVTQPFDRRARNED